MRSSGPSISLCFTRLLFQVAIRALGFEVKKADVLKILKDYDKEGKGKVTFQDFNEISESIINYFVDCTTVIKDHDKLHTKYCYVMLLDYVKHGE